MKMRLKLLAAVALLGIPLAACEEATPPPPVGSIVGTVSIEGTGIDGVSVNLSNGNSTTTAGGGSYRFDNVEGGAYTVTISGFPSDATFDATSAAATISSAGQSVTVNFTGAYIRTASVMGTVTVENMGLPGVTVTLTGVSGASAVTDGNGQYAFTGLRMGSYSVEISGFDSDEVGFSNTAASVAVGVGESKIVSFDGTYLRTAAIMGQVSIEGVGLEGVNVSLAGGPDGADMTTMTDAAGLYTFAKLRAGDYAVGISGYDTDEYEFEVTSQNVTVALGETANVPFDGILLRTSGIAGRVSVGGMGIADVTVTISADGMDDVTAMTDASGQYAVSALAAGDYTVTISGYDAVEYMFEDSQDVTLAMDMTEIVNFEGTALRTASVSVSVTADGEGVAGAGVTLTMVTGATSGTVLGTSATDADGAASFGPLLAGAYRVDIAVDSDEIDFESMDATVMVATAEAASVSFAGTINRTGSIGGMVTVDGEGMEGVSVMLSGGGDMVADTMMTGDDGSYSFSDLRKGDYTVAIMNPDEARYEFSSTSESVSLAVGQEQSVNFAGAMTRSSSISGTVSVEGSGLAGVTVTLSGDGAGTDTSDAAGGYAFTGLGAGDYTVAISGQDADAYVFETTSMDVMVGDNEAATANFSGMHARSASVTVKLFIDELMKNDMYDEGEEMFPTAGMLAAVAQAGLPLALPVTLEGPGVGETNAGTTMPDGSVVFSDLRAGAYQLSVSDISAEQLTAIAAVAPQLAVALADYAFGGDPAGYPLDVAVGEAKMAHAPIDITHTTINLAVTLRSGMEMGDALPGASVMLYSDEDGDDMVGAGMTDEMGMTTIRVARAGTSDNMVYAGISHDDYSGPEDMQAVMWDPQMTYTAAANTGDIVNLNVDATFGGATVDRGDYGGGDALAGWAISVTMGDSAVADAPEMLDDDGMGAFTTTVESVPATFTIAVADDQDDDMDGGESYEGTDVEYTHTGLSLAGTMDAGMIEVTYTTQKLKVSVHHERDQVMGYTGNVLGGDKRVGGMVDVSIRYIDSEGRSRSYTKAEWDAGDNTHSSKGVTTFSGLPAGDNIIVQATEVADGIMLLDPDELATYHHMEANGVTGGAFGDNGGFSHTVELCPLMATDPTGQDHGECSSFAYVSTYTVSGLFWRASVATKGDDFEEKDPDFSDTGTIGLTPVEGKNLAGEEVEVDLLAKESKKDKGDDHSFTFEDVAAGAYELNIPDGWRARTPVDEEETKGATGMLGYALNPLGGDLEIDVTPATGTLYGRVTGADNFAAAGATVNVNGEEATTDALGRYIVEGFGSVKGGSRSPTNPLYRNQLLVVVTTSNEGSVTRTDTLFWSDEAGNKAAADDDEYDYTDMWNAAGTPVNNPTRYDIDVSGVVDKVTITGNVTDILTSDGIAGVEIKVDGSVPLNKKSGKVVTDSDGNYSAEIRTKDRGATAMVSVSKKGYHFPVDASPVLADGNSPAVVNFQGYENGTITGTVEGPDGRALQGVVITATSTAEGATTAADTDTTNSVGQFSLSVPPVSTYRIDASMGNHVFEYPNNNQAIFAGPGQTASFGRIKAMTAGALGVKAVRERVPDDTGTPDTDESDPTRWGTTIRVEYEADPENLPEEYDATSLTYTIQTNTGTDGAWEAATGTAVTNEAGTDTTHFTIPTPAATSGGDGEFMVRVVAAANEVTVSTPAAPFGDTSATATVAAVDPSATGVSARRQAAAADTMATASGNFIQASWTAVTNANSDFRLVAQVTAASLGGQTVWVVVAGPTTATGTERALVSADISTITTAATAIPSGDGTTVTVTEEELAAAIQIAVESVQGTADATDDGPKWTRSDEVELAARTSS